jgi:peptidoglycan biosynthesis protein MviN/MurJ (putative lipid II flippase)
VIFNFILIPPLGAEGAALNAVISGVLLAGWTLRRARQRFGAIGITRVIAAPLLASGAMTAFALATGTALTVYGVLAAGVVYAGALLVVERLIFPGDFRVYAGLRPQRSRV